MTHFDEYVLTYSVRVAIPTGTPFPDLIGVNTKIHETLKGSHNWLLAGSKVELMKQYDERPA